MKSNRIINNAKWIIVCKIVQSLLQMIIGMITARYLGPSNYGLIGYAGSVVAFAIPLTMLGLKSTLIQELVEAPEAEGEIMGTAIAMDLLSALLCFAGVCAFVTVANAGERETLIVCALYSISLFFHAFEVMHCWFQYKLASKYPSMVALGAYVIVSVYKIYVLISQKSVYWFAVVQSVDLCVAGGALVIIYNKLGGRRFSCSWAMMKRLFSRGKYYVLSAMMVTVFQNTDHVMLKTMIGDVENGYYTAAVTSAVVVQFVYTAITDSMRPVILQSKQQDTPDYEKNIGRLFCVTFYLAMLQGIGFTIFANLIIRILYGAAYFSAVPVLRIIVWQIGFSFMGSVRNIWILAEGKQHLVWKLNLAGVLLNVAGNAVLIPILGATGAAIASLATQVFTNFLLTFVVKELKACNRIMMVGLHPKTLGKLLKDGYEQFIRPSHRDCDEKG